MRSWDKYCEDTEKALVHFIDANTERIFKLQQQNMKLREEIRKLQRGD